MQKNEVIIIGGGLAGLIASIHLSNLGFNVIVIEKNNYPKHKVCGEYISNEVLPYLKFLNIDIQSLEPTNITKLQFSIQNGTSISTTLPLGGFGISRYVLDEFLYKNAIQNGCKIIQDTVENVHFRDDEFTITTTKNDVYKSKIVIGAFGKRSNIDQKLNRDFIQKKSFWLGVKAHYSGNFDDDLVGLHNFDGGYCGVSKVENNHINVCYLADYESFKKHKNFQEYQKNVLEKNLFLKNLFDNSTLLFEKPLTISQISFNKKQIVENHILMIGDTAGLIHPLCGNGMAMAIHSAKIASETVANYLDGAIASRKYMELIYEKTWKKHFERRLKMGRLLGKLLQKPKLSSTILRIFVQMPFMLPLLIKKTHGKPF